MIYYIHHDARVTLISNLPFKRIGNKRFKGVVHAGKALSKAHNFLFLHNNLIKISGIVVHNLWNTFYF
jgi:hypothetical protein